MVTLPGPSDVRKQSPRGQLGDVAVPHDRSGEGLAAVGSAVSQLSNVFRQVEKDQEAREAADYSARALADARIRAFGVADKLSSPVEEAPDVDETDEDYRRVPPTMSIPPAAKLQSGLESELKTIRADLLRNAPSDAARQMFEKKFETLRANTMIRSAAAYSVIAEKVRARNLNSLLSRLEVDALRNPDSLNDIKALGADALHDAAENGFAGVAKRAEAFRAGVTEAAVKGLIQRDPHDALRRLESREFDEEIGDADLIISLQREARTVIDREQRIRTAELSRSVKDAIFVLDRGKVPSGVEALLAKTKGTEFAEPLQEAIEDAGRVQIFLRQTPAEQRRELGKEPTDRRGVVLHDRLRRAHAGMVKQIKDGNGLAVAAEVGVIGPLGPLTMEPDAIRQRAAKAEVASRHFGVPVAPFLPAEADAIESTLQNQSPDIATGTLAALHQGLGDTAGALVETLADKSPEMALALVNVADRPALSREIIQGGRLLSQNRDVRPGKEDRLPIVESVFAGVFTPDTATALRPIVDAAAALYAARKVPSGDFTFDADMFEGALSEVVGGVIELNGRKVIAPVPGMGEGDFEDLVEKLTAPDLVEFGNGVPVFADGTGFTVDMLESRFFGAEAQLVTSGFGRYLVFFPGLGYVQAADGGPYEIDLRKFAQ